jgi:hypothetical protein
MSRSVALLICLVGGLTMLVSPFLPMATGWANDVTDWFNILAAMAFVLGGGSLLKVQLMRLSARGPGWGYSAVTLLAFIVTLWVGLGKVGVVADPSAPTVAWSGKPDDEGSAFWWIYLYVMTPITSTLFAVLVLRRERGVPRVPREEPRGHAAAGHGVRDPARPHVRRRGAHGMAARLGERAAAGESGRHHHGCLQHRWQPRDHHRDRAGRRLDRHPPHARSRSQLPRG